jgi:NAD(P)-dependent dehydrogenase (short-subunit alcohol dehydrogenase family)
MERHSSLALHDQRVLVIGGTSGMGLGAAQAALDAGAAILVAGRRPLAERRALEAPDARIRHAVVDITDETSVRALFDEAGALDHVVVTAAPAPGSWGPFLERDVTEIRRYLDEKLIGSLTCARYAAPRLRAGGSITFVTGVAAVKPRPGMAMVSVAFAALEALGRALAVELGPLRVNTIRPGFIDSDMWSFLDHEAREQIREKVRSTFPVRRTGAIEDIGHAAVFLMTNRYVTGATLEVTGGEQFVDAF